VWNEYVVALEEAGRKSEWRQAINDAQRLGHTVPLITTDPYPSPRLTFVAQSQAASLGQLRLLRRIVGRVPEGTERDTIVQEARSLLASRSSTGDDRDKAEHVLLLSGLGRLSEAEVEVEVGLRRHPSSVPLRHASARIGLDAVYRDSRFSDAKLQALRTRYQALADVDPGLSSVSALGQTRAALALVDGHAADTAASEAVKVFEQMSSSNVGSDHRRWWNQRTRELIDLAVPDTNVSLDELRTAASLQAEALDRMEEVLVMSSSAELVT
jgi:hypothetical protein